MMSEQKEVSYPIRLMFGIGNNIIQGFSIVYEKPDGAAERINVWYDHPIFARVQFIGEGESRVIFKEFVTEQSKSRIGRFLNGGNEEPKKEMLIDKILIRRDWQFAGSRPAASAVVRTDGILLRS